MNYVVILLLLTALYSGTSAKPSKNPSCSVAECVNSGNTNLSTMILCNVCMAKVYTNRDAASFFQKAQREVIDVKNVDQKLDELIPDVLYLILENLDISDMLNLLEAYPAQSLVAVGNDIFRRKYKDSKVYSGNTLIRSIEVERNSQSICAVGGRFQSLLFFFGGTIRDLDLYESFTVDIQFIKKYSNDSLANSMKSNLQFINHFVPNLENLTIHDSLQVGNEPVHFEHVKRFRWDRRNSNSIEKLSFSQLESVNIKKYFSNRFNVWMDFLRRHRNVSRLHITLIDGTGYSQLVELTKALPNLTELTVIQCQKIIYLDVIGQLLERNRKLQKFVFWTEARWNDEINFLEGQYEDDWYVSREHYGRWEGVSMEFCGTRF